MISLTGSKEDMLAIFREQVKAGRFSENKHQSTYDGTKYDRRDTVDGNPSAADKMCQPYTGTPTVRGKIGLNGKIGGNGTFGD